MPQTIEELRAEYAALKDALEIYQLKKEIAAMRLQLEEERSPVVADSSNNPGYEQAAFSLRQTEQAKLKPKQEAASKVNTSVTRWGGTRPAKRRTLKWGNSFPQTCWFVTAGDFRYAAWSDGLQYEHSDGKVDMSQYGGDATHDYFLCFTTFLTKQKCPHGRSCRYRHDRLTEDELLLIIARKPDFVDRYNHRWVLDGQPEPTGIPVPPAAMPFTDEQKEQLEQEYQLGDLQPEVDRTLRREGRCGRNWEHNADDQNRAAQLRLLEIDKEKAAKMADKPVAYDERFDDDDWNFLSNIPVRAVGSSQD
ncbi:hypothetical protein BDV95DRAFT_610517 [Massariosphaeria phaeospora]|uniref:C3H1-type domain-containing protein n=1 Tax=Massariosphaeria phaeospora TaxID=100035 RepID=A0A7C8M201_9PLEO|nr:hypothetical protein BDV95DRAFT_610517 [Massariosphaeria phaeospora]